MKNVPQMFIAGVITMTTGLGVGGAGISLK
jgi:hypothetical protein